MEVPEQKKKKSPDAIYTKTAEEDYHERVCANRCEGCDRDLVDPVIEIPSEEQRKMNANQEAFGAEHYQYALNAEIDEAMRDVPVEEEDALLEREKDLLRLLVDFMAERGMKVVHDLFKGKTPPKDKGLAKLYRLMEELLEGTIYGDFMEKYSDQMTDNITKRAEKYMSRFKD